MEATRTKRGCFHGAAFAAARAFPRGFAFFAVLSALGCALPSTPAAAAELQVEVTGLRSGDGAVHLAANARPDKLAMNGEALDVIWFAPIRVDAPDAGLIE